MSACAVCGEPHACFGIGPPLLPEQAWYCAVCVGFQPATLQLLAYRARAALDDPSIIIR